MRDHTAVSPRAGKPIEGDLWRLPRLGLLHDWLTLSSVMEWELDAQVRWLAGDMKTAQYLAARRAVQTAASAFAATLESERRGFGRDAGLCEHCNDHQAMRPETLCENCAQARDEALLDEITEDEARFALISGGQ